MSNPSVNLLKSLYQKRVKFTWHDFIKGPYESTGVVIEYHVSNNFLIVKDDKSGFNFHLRVDQVELIKEVKKRSGDMQVTVDALTKKCFGKSLSEIHAERICIQCRKKIGEFTDDESRMEYEISGLCESCQKDFFDTEEK